MALAFTSSRTLCGLSAEPVRVEVDISNGLPAFYLVGLPETEVRESRDRVRSAIRNSQFEFPPRRITINLAPADLPKEGARLDLPMALGILAAMGVVPSQQLDVYEYIGELALSGALRAVKGVLPIASACAKAGKKLILPAENAAEAALIEGLELYPAKHLLEVVSHLCGQQPLPAYPPSRPPESPLSYPDLSEVRGQERAKRSLEVAAAGVHSLLMMGPPGSGKTMLASRLVGILPPMTDQEALETAMVSSLGPTGFHVENWKKRPFRAPHHSSSLAALVGGGSQPRPGEISLAHSGVLCLDEFGEFSRPAIEALREPLESGHISIARAAARVTYPARFQLIATMNPCPCGYLGHPSQRCRCSLEQVQRYRHKISGPVLDRIDLVVEVPSVDQATLLHKASGEASQQVRERVMAAYERQLKRQGKANSQLDPSQIDEVCALSEDNKTLLAEAFSRLGLSARGYHRVLRVARTLADLENAPSLQRQHVLEALAYRRALATS